MNISAILSEESIFLGVSANSKRDFLQEVSRRISEITGLDALTVFDSLLERENLGSTGFGGGTALPHSRFTGLDKVYAFFAKPSSAIDFDAIDGKPVDLAFILISPEGSGADHLTALAMLSRILKDESICDKLRHMNKVPEIYATLNEA